jgi:maltose O-acetyltransferase
MGRWWRELLRWKAWWMFGQSNIHVYGNFTAINPKVIKVGANCAINHGVFMVGLAGITVGSDVVLSARCMLVDTGLEIDSAEPATSRAHTASAIVIEDGAWIGAGAIILGGVTVGTKSIVGAGSVVTRDVPAMTVVAGNPARVLRKVNDARG